MAECPLFAFAGLAVKYYRLKIAANTAGLQSKSSFESAGRLRHRASMNHKADVIIIGGGLIGLTQALALASHGITSHVIDRADQASMLQAGFDGPLLPYQAPAINCLKPLDWAKHWPGKAARLKRFG